MGRCGSGAGRSIKAALVSLLYVVGLSGPLALAGSGTAAAANAPSTTLYVATTGNDQGGDNLCNVQTSPCATVDQAVYAADYWGGAVTVQVAAGTYTQQVAVAPGSATFNEKPGTTLGTLTALTLTGAGVGATTVELPAGASKTIPSVRPAVSGHPIVFGIGVTSLAPPVMISNMTIDGNRAANAIDGCGSDYLAGIVFEDASGTVDQVNVTNWAPQTNVGCGVGQGVRVESSATGEAQVTVEQSTVTGYGKAGIFAGGPHAVLTAQNNDPVSSSPTSGVATNGIEIDYGASGTVSGNTVTGNDYTGTPNATDPQADYAAGVLLYGAGTVTVSANTLADNQIGIESVASIATIGGSTAAAGNTISETGSGIQNSIGIYAVPCDTYCTGVGVATGGTYTLTVQNNNISGIPQSYGQDSNPTVVSAGIWIGNTAAAGATGSVASTISDNAVSGGYFGIMVAPNSAGATATIDGNQVDGFMRTGINAGSFALGGDGVSATIANNTVKGEGSGNTDPWAENGIEIANGGTGSITGNRISGVIYTGSQPAQASAITVFESSNVSVNGNTIVDSQVGVAVQTAGYSSDHANWTMAGDSVTGNTIGFDSSYRAPGVGAGEMAGTWGIWPASYCAACSVQATIGNNALNGAASTAGNVPSVGIQVGDTGSAGAAGSVNVSIVGNSITGWIDGIADMGTTGGATFSSVASFNDLSGNTIVGLGNFTGSASGTTAVTGMSAQDNWWGSPNGTVSPGSAVTGSIQVNPWLASVALSGATSVASGSPVSVTATLLDSNGSPATGNPPLTLAFSTSPAGACSPASGTATLSSGSTASFSCTAGSAGSPSLTATVEFGGQASTLAASSALTVSTPPSQSVTRTLAPGWNTLSLPFPPSSSGSTLGSVLSDGGSSVIVAYTYNCAGVSNPSSGNCWQQVTGALPPPMQGLYVSIQGGAHPTATLTPTSAQNAPPAFALQQGWNLVGPSALSGSETDQGFLNGVSPAAVPELVDPNGTPVAITDPAADTSHQVQDGYAYWVYAESGGQTLVGQIPTGSANP